MTPQNLTTEFRSGLIFAITAFGFWGFVQPYFFTLFQETSALTLMAHRTIWSCLFIWIWLILRGKVTSALALFTDWKMVGVLALTGLLITSNWGTYIYAVQSGHLLEASIGYFITPLMTAAFGIMILNEQVRRLQYWALGFAAFGVSAYTLYTGQFPVIALILALSFSCYGGIRKLAGAPAERGMAVETALMAPLALGIIAATGWVGLPYGIAHTQLEAGLLICAGLVTLLPLVWYNAAAARMPLISLGLLQFIVPIALFIVSLLPPLNETLDLAKALMFFFIWIGLALYILDLLRFAAIRGHQV